MNRLIIIFLFMLTLSACSEQALYSDLPERQVNEMVAVLQIAGLPAAKKDLGKGLFSVTIQNRYFADAVEYLRANGYPREQFENLGSVFEKEGFVSSPLEENARLVFALSQEIANTISSIDGVVMARVHLAMPEQNPLDEAVKPASASVFIKHRREIDLTSYISKIKSLVVNGVEGLPYDNVTVALFAMKPMLKSPIQNRSLLNASATEIDNQLILKVLIGSIALILIIIFFWIRFKRKKITSFGHE